MFATSIAWVSCLSAWLTPAPVEPLDCLVRPTWTPHVVKPAIAHRKSRQWLYEHVRSITVKVKTGQNGGSGILIQRQGRLYTVLTNRHVTTPGAPYVIQTPDGRSHPATLAKKFNFRDTDLAMLQFHGRSTYAIAPLGRKTPLSEGTPVIAAGFPLEPLPNYPQGLLITTGHISLLPPQPFQGGYQIGYTNLIRQGMSGGPVLNLNGEVIGINSLHAYPLWGDPYIFQDGSKPPPAQRQQVIRSSWAVPITQFQAVVKNQ